MSYVNLGWNADGGFRKVRVHMDRVPIEGERIEFWNPDGGAAEVDPELDGNVWFVNEVTWVAHSSEGGPRAEPIVFIIPKSELQSED